MKRISPPCSHEELRRIIGYDPKTGKFSRRNCPFCGAKSPSGRQPGHRKESGYRVIRVRSKLLYEHVLAWFYVTGEWPTLVVDHINGNKSDNRFSNLRLATHQQNAYNQRPKSNKKHSLKGVSPYPYGFRSFIRIGRKSVSLGTFKTAEEAHAAYVAAAKKHHGEYARSE